jgi:aerobic carbon-monoxide dehydrogenase small subunit
MIELFPSIALTVNGEGVRETVDPRTSLVDFLRERLGLTGSHVGCEQGVCGACTVRLDGVTARGCLVLAVQCAGSRVETIEGVSDSGEIADLQDAFVRRNALQCGFCTPGMLLTAQELLAQCGMPSREEIRAHLSGNYCRCTGYQAIVDAVEAVARARLASQAGGEIGDPEESPAIPHPGSPSATRPSASVGDSVGERSRPAAEQRVGRPRSQSAP